MGLGYSSHGRIGKGEHKNLVAAFWAERVNDWTDKYDLVPLRFIG